MGQLRERSHVKDGFPELEHAQVIVKRRAILCLRTAAKEICSLLNVLALARGDSLGVSYHISFEETVSRNV